MESFHKLLSNEQSFDALFCTVGRLTDGTFYYNKEFVEDPIYNHFVIDDNVFSLSSSSLDPRIETMLLNLREEARKSNIAISIFVEDFWPKNIDIEEELIQNGFRIGEKMEIFLKKLSREQNETILESHRDLSVFKTSDIDLWNRAFIDSFAIPDTWTKELEKRLTSLVQKNKESSTLLVAKDQDASFGSGCLLLHRFPRNIMGVYCVGTIPSMRGQGVARAMLKFSEKFALDEGCDNMTLQTMVMDNVSPMYLKMGYELQFRRNVFQN